MSRSLFVLFVIAQAAAVFAQPIVGPEVVSGRLATSVVASPFPSSAVAMARDRAGVAIAWNMPMSGVERIFVTRLDATAHAIGATVIAPVTNAAADAYAPSIAAAPDGNGFVLTWLERLRSTDVLTTNYCRFGGSLNASAPAMLAFHFASDPPPIVRSGASTWIAAGRRLWRVRDDGSLDGPTDAAFEAADMTIADTPQLIAATTETARRRLFACGSRADCTAAGGVASGAFACKTGVACDVTVDISHLQFAALLWTVDAVQFDFGTSNSAAVENDGRDTLVAWLNGSQKSGGDVVAARLGPASRFHLSGAVPQVIGTFAADGEASRPDIASDADRFVIVWRTRMPDGTHDIAGAALDREGRVTPLAIPSTAADERDPSIVATGNGTFLIGYEKLESGERHIAGRIVSFGARRRTSYRCASTRYKSFSSRV